MTRKLERYESEEEREGKRDKERVHAKGEKEERKGYRRR